MWHWAAVMDLPMVGLHGLTLETSLCIQLTYTWRTFCWSKAGRLTVCVHQHRGSANVQDFDRAVKQTDSGKNFKGKPRLPAIKDQVVRLWSSISFFYLTSGVKPRWSTFQINQKWKMGPEPTRYNSQPSLHYCFKDTYRRGIIVHEHANFANQVPH